MSITVRTNINYNRLTQDMKNKAKIGLQDCVDNLVMASSQSAPHKKGILEKSHSKEFENDGLKAVVSYSVRERGADGTLFNYALKMHETDYTPSQKSLAKGGGVGMSGKRYPVGKGFLGDILKGEQQTYINHIKRMITDNRGV